MVATGNGGSGEPVSLSPEAGTTPSGLYVTQFTSTGAFVRSSAFSGDGRAAAVACNTAGDIFLTGGYVSIDFGGGMLPAQNSSMFVAHLDANQHYVNARLFSATLNLNPTQIVPGANGEVWVAGNFQGAPDFGQGPLGSVVPRALQRRGSDNRQRWLR